MPGAFPTRENSMKRMFQRLTRARAALIGVATVTVGVAITGLIAQPGSAVALPGSAVALPLRVRAVADGRAEHQRHALPSG